MIEKRIFIVGCPRSGTTLLQAILTAHPQVTSFPESHFFSILKNPRPLKHWLMRSNKAAADKRIMDFAAELGKAELINSEKLQKARSYAQHINIFTELLDAVAEERKASVWIEKTPRHLHNLKLIKLFYKKPLFIHLLRDGISTIASLYKVARENPEAWDREKSLEVCIKRWLNDVQMQEQYRGKQGHFFCTYDDLLYRREVTIKSLCSFTGLPFQPVMLENFSSSFEQIVEKGESWKANVNASIKNRSRASSILTAQELDYVKEKIKGIKIQ